MNVVIYHNSRCSKSRATLELLNSKNVDPAIVNYLDTPPSKEQLKEVLGLLGKKPQEMIRFKEKVAVELNLSANDDRDEDSWLELMVNNPILIERPIVVAGDKAVVGRPPENVLDLF